MVTEQGVIDQLVQEAEYDNGHLRMLRLDHGDFTLVEWLKDRPIRESREGRWKGFLDKFNAEPRPPKSSFDVSYIIGWNLMTQIWSSIDGRHTQEFLGKPVVLTEALPNGKEIIVEYRIVDPKQ